MNIVILFQYTLRMTLIGIIWFLSACSVNEIQQTPPLKAHESWVMLPFINHGDTPDAGERAADIAEALLRSLYNARITSVQQSVDEQQIPEFNQQKTLESAIKNAQSQGSRYGLTGSVQEWRYKAGLDAEPAVGVTLNVIDLGSGNVIWTASGARTGWGRESLSGVGHKLIEDLLDGLPLTE